jgi:hypothetical protein
MKEITSRTRRAKEVFKQPVLSSIAARRPIPNRPGERAESRTTKRNVSRKPTRIPAANDDRAGLELQPGAGAAQAHHGQDLAQLVWKYFEAEIREAITEVAGSLSREKLKPRQELSGRKLEGKR